MLIERSVAADPSFQTIQLEKVWRSTRNPKARRQPDVRADSARLGSLAFEAQLSTTFLDVVVARRAFYREEGALLVWVLGHFLPEYRRLMIDDLLFSNNSNVFVVDDETASISEARNALHMRCFFRRPVRNERELVDEWCEEIVPFDRLIWDAEKQTAFFFDYSGEEAKLKAAIAAEVAAERAQSDKKLRSEFFALLKASDAFHAGDSSDLRGRWNMLVDALASRAVEIPSSRS